MRATPSRPHQFIALDADARRISPCDGGANMSHLLRMLWNDEGQDIAEYAVMLAVILVLVVGTIRLVGSNANNAFSSAEVRFNDAVRMTKRTPRGCV